MGADDGSRRVSSSGGNPDCKTVGNPDGSAMRSGKKMKKLFKKQTTVMMVIAIVLSFVLGICGVIGAFSAFPGLMPPSLREKGRTDTQVIHSMQRTKEVSLLRLGVTGIISRENKSHFFSMEIPGSERAQFIQYTFDAKLGFEGKDVVIKEAGDNTFDVAIPEFKFIGYDHPEYRIVVEQNGALSFGTQQIDTLDMVNNILTDKAKKEYVDSNRDILEEQAKSFYTSIVQSVSPDTKLNFTFQQAEGD